MFSTRPPTRPGNYWAWFPDDDDAVPMVVFPDKYCKGNLRVSGAFCNTKDLNTVVRNTPGILWEPIKPHSNRRPAGVIDNDDKTQD
jgi:hypothetical protein